MHTNTHTITQERTTKPFCRQGKEITHSSKQTESVPSPKIQSEILTGKIKDEGKDKKKQTKIHYCTSQHNTKLRNQSAHFAATWTLSWCSPCLKSRVGLGPRILSLWVQDGYSFISSHVLAVVPVILVKPIDTMPLSSDKHSHIFKHLRDSENCRSLFSEDCLESLTLVPQASNNIEN